MTVWRQPLVNGVRALRMELASRSTFYIAKRAANRAEDLECELGPREAV